MNGEEQMAIINRVEFGWHPDFDMVKLNLDVNLDECVGTMLILTADQALDILQQGRTTIDRLKGKPIWVRREGGFTRYVRPWKA